MKVLEKRGGEYGNSWHFEGFLWKCVGDYQRQFGQLPISKSVYQSVVFHIIGKIGRLVFNPEHLDSWHDIQGYARLAEGHIQYGSYHGEGKLDLAVFHGIVVDLNTLSDEDKVTVLAHEATTYPLHEKR